MELENVKNDMDLNHWVPKHKLRKVCEFQHASWLCNSRCIEDCRLSRMWSPSTRSSSSCKKEKSSPTSSAELAKVWKKIMISFDISNCCKSQLCITRSGNIRIIISSIQHLSFMIRHSSFFYLYSSFIILHHTRHRCMYSVVINMSSSFSNYIS